MTAALVIDSDKGKPKYLEKNLSKYHFVHHRQHKVYVYRTLYSTENVLVITIYSKNY